MLDLSIYAFWPNRIMDCFKAEILYHLLSKAQPIEDILPNSTNVHYINEK